MTQPPCRVCGDSHTGFFAEKDGYEYARCAACGFVFLDPMPDAAALAGQYAGAAIGAEAYPKAASRFRRARVKALRLVRYVRGNETIDLGCGGGFMVEAMRRLGARATGVDVNPGAIAYASRRFAHNRFYCDDLAAFDGRGLAFDFVYASEVMEHLPDIDAFMGLIARITRPGGHVYVTTPDIGHWRVPRRRDQMGHVQPADARAVLQSPLSRPPVRAPRLSRAAQVLQAQARTACAGPKALNAIFWRYPSARVLLQCAR